MFSLYLYSNIVKVDIIYISRDFEGVNVSVDRLGLGTDIQRVASV